MSIEDIKKMLEIKNGASFIPADLFIHSPSSNKFNPPLMDGKVVDNATFLNLLFKRLKETNIKMIGIADENLGMEEKGGYKWLDIIKTHLAEKGITVFPGFITELKNGLRILSLFDSTKKGEELNEMLSSFGLSTGRRFFRNKKPIPINIDYRVMLTRIKKKGGLNILLYDNEENNDFIELIKDPYITGIFLKGNKTLTEKAEQIISNNEENKLRRFPLTSIHVSGAESIKEIGTKRVYIRVGEPSIEGLRIAFIDWKTKIKAEGDYFPTQYPRILAASWEGGFLSGIKIHFNENMNCLIGGRGTGKTTAIETIRYALNQLPKTERNRKEHQQILKDVFQTGSKISLIIETGGFESKRYIITRTYPFPPDIYDFETLEKKDYSPEDIFSVDIYGSKEIYEISKKPNFQLSLLERFVEKKLIKFSEKEKELRIKLRKNTEELISLLKELDEKRSLISLLPSIEEKLQRFEEMEIPEKLNEKRMFEKEKHIIEKNKELTLDIERRLLDVITEIREKIPQEKDEEVLNKEIINNYYSHIDNYINTFVNTINHLIAELKTKEAILKEATEEWEIKYAKAEDSFKEGLRKLQEIYPDVDINEFINLETEARRLRDIKIEIDQLLQRKDMLYEEREKLISNLHDIFNSKFTTMQKEVERWNKHLKNKIKTEIYNRPDNKTIKNLLGLYYPEIDNNTINSLFKTNDFSLQTLIKNARKGIQSLMEIYKINEEDALVIMKNDRLLKLEEEYIPPHIEISLNVGSENEPLYRHIDHLSDGQRCTAVLGILLLPNEIPLIVDQPEEDLDNSFIVEEVVERLRQAKDKRQFIIATHNANIPVLGDAEEIIALRAELNRSYIDNSSVGYIDNPSIKKLVEKILEGGKSALIMRMKKYGV